MNSSHQKCPFQVGMRVKFSPGKRTEGLYQDITNFGLTPRKNYEITEIKNELYLYFKEGGGWPWNELQPTNEKEKTHNNGVSLTRRC